MSLLFLKPKLGNAIFLLFGAWCFGFSFAPIANAQAIERADYKCATQTFGDAEFDYCVYPTTDSQNHDLIVHLHGLGGSARTWYDHERHINTRREMALLGKSVPTVVTISFGNLWLLTEVQERGDKYHLVRDKILPFLKEQAGYNGAGRMILMGESMGGFNALQFYLKDPQLFSRYVIMCPAVGELNPWSSSDDVDAFIERTKASRFRVSFYLEVARHNFKDMAEWQAHDPLQLVKTQVLNMAPIYISGDEHDQYGFYAGDKILDSLLGSKPREHQWRSVNGRHCEVDSKSIAQFL